MRTSAPPSLRGARSTAPTTAAAAGGGALVSSEETGSGGGGGAPDGGAGCAPTTTGGADACAGMSLPRSATPAGANASVRSLGDEDGTSTRWAPGGVSNVTVVVGLRREPLVSTSICASPAA